MQRVLQIYWQSIEAAVEWQEVYDVRAIKQCALLHVPASREHAQGNRLPVQSDYLRVSTGTDDWRCVRVFFKNRQSVKLLKWDNDGFLLYQKRLERGSFEMPRKNADTGYYELSWETFSFIMSGISLESVQFRKRYRTQFICR